MSTEKALQETILKGASLLLNNDLGLFPYEYSGWRDEAVQAHKNAYLGTSLMNSPIFDLSGTGAVDFLQKFSVNRYDKMKIGSIRHAIMCNEKGQIMADGVVMKIGENHFRTYWLDPCISFLFEKFGSDYDLQGSDLSGQETFFKLMGQNHLK